MCRTGIHCRTRRSSRGAPRPRRTPACAPCTSCGWRRGLPCTLRNGIRGSRIRWWCRAVGRPRVEAGGAWSHRDATAPRLDLARPLLLRHHRRDLPTRCLTTSHNTAVPRAEVVRPRERAGDLRLLGSSLRNAVSSRDVSSAAPRFGLIPRFSARVPRGQHLNQKPVEFMERIISATTRPGDVVWEPFGGLASASAAALRLGRMPYAAEITPMFAGMAQDRLAREVLRLTA